MMQVPADEDDIHAKTQQIALEYEKKMQKVTAELAEARATSERTAVEMDKLRAESEAKQRQLYADFAVRAESERVSLQRQFDAEMERVRGELETARRSKELVRGEIESLRRQYEAAMFSVENSVPPDQLAAERERLRDEYEANMKTMRDELDSVKASRASVELEMQNLKADYETQLNARRSSTTAVSASTSTGPLTIVSDQQLRQQNLTDEMKMESADSLHRAQTDDTVSSAPENSVAEQRSSDLISSVQSKLLTDSLSKFSADREPSPIDVNRLERSVSSTHETGVSKMKAELEDFKKIRDDIAEIIYRIKTEYREAVWRAEETVPRNLLDVEKQQIRATYEQQMDRVKDDLQSLKSRRDIVIRQLAGHESAWKDYEEEKRKIDADVEAGRVEQRGAPQLIEAAARRYLEDTQRRSMAAAADKANVLTSAIDERFEREKQLVREDVEDGKLTESEVVDRIDELIKAKAAELIAVRDETNYDSAEAADEDAVRDEAAETNANRKLSATKSSSAAVAEPSKRRTEAGDAAATRLKTLENMFIQGGGDVAGAAVSGQGAEHCRLIREKLRREKLNAEEKRRRLEEAHKSTEDGADAASALYDVFASAQDEIVAKTTALQQLRSQNEHLQREISDIQAPLRFAVVILQLSLN